MKKIGLTGGIGSGKTVIANIFEKDGFPVYFADLESKKITASSMQVREKLAGKFGESLYEGGALDKKLLASLIFDNKENFDFVNSVIHPFVFEDFQLWADKQVDAVSPIVVESAILFESGFNKYVDFVVNVSAPESVRVQRVLERDDLSREEILSRMRNQLADEEREQLADYTIINDGCLALLPQVKELVKKLKVLS